MTKEARWLNWGSFSYNQEKINFEEVLTIIEEVKLFKDLSQSKVRKCVADTEERIVKERTQWAIYTW